MHTHGYMQTTPPLPRTCGLQKHISFWKRGPPACMHCLWEMWVLQFCVNPLIHMPIRKTCHQFTCMQLIGMRYCSLCIAYCTDSPLAVCRLLGVYQGGCSVLAETGHEAGEATSGSVKPGFDKQYFAARCLPDLLQIFLVLFYFLG